MRIRNLQKRIVLMVGVLALTITLTLGGVFGLSSSQTIQAEASTSLSLFNVTGQMTRQQAQNIMTALGNTSNVNTSIDRNMQFRLFPDANYGSQYAVALARLNWRIVNADNDRITFWASNTYRTSAYGTTTLYASSTIRQNIIDDFNHVLSRIGTIGNHIMPKGSTAFGAVAGDLIWLPAIEETRYNGVWGFTEETTNLRGFTPHAEGGTNANQAFLRYGHFVRPPHSIDEDLPPFHSINYCGVYFHFFGAGTILRGVRPAVHISRASIEAAADNGAGGGVNPPDNNDNNNNNGNNTDNNFFEDGAGIALLVLGGLVGLIVIIILFGGIARLLKRRN